MKIKSDRVRSAWKSSTSYAANGRSAAEHKVLYFDIWWNCRYMCTTRDKIIYNSSLKKEMNCIILCVLLNREIGKLERVCLLKLKRDKRNVKMVFYGRRLILCCCFWFFIIYFLCCCLFYNIFPFVCSNSNALLLLKNY